MLVHRGRKKGKVLEALKENLHFVLGVLIALWQGARGSRRCQSVRSLPRLQDPLLPLYTFHLPRQEVSEYLRGLSVAFISLWLQAEASGFCGLKPLHLQTARTQPQNPSLPQTPSRVEGNGFDGS